MLKTVLTNSTARRSCQLLALCAATLLAACGGGGGGNNDNEIALTLQDTTIAPGESTLLNWDAGGLYQSCTLSATSQAEQPVPLSSGDEGFSTGVIENAGTYTFTLRCTGNFGDGVGTAVLSVVGPAVSATRDCGIGLAPTQALLASDGATVAANTGVATFCIGCSVDNPNNIVSKDPADDLTETYAQINTNVLSVNGATSITVSGVPGGTGSYPAGPAGFLISTGDDTVLAGDARRELTVQTLKDGEVVETYTTDQSSFLGFTTQPNPIVGGQPFTIDFLGLTYSTVPNGTVIFLGFNAAQPYDAIRLGSATKFSGNELRVYAACVGVE